MTTTTTLATAAQASVPTLEEFATRWDAIDTACSDLPPVAEASDSDRCVHFLTLAAFESDQADLLYEVYQASAHVLPNMMLHIAVSDSIEAHRRRATEYEQVAAGYARRIAKTEQGNTEHVGGGR